MATTERDFYLVLGVERTATDAEIKRAYRKLAQQWHPDVNADEAAHDRFTEINEAYQVLSDPEQRGRYDTFGRAGLGGAGTAGFEGFGGFSDIFDAFFGGGSATSAARRGRPQPGADLRYDLRITFTEAVKGTEKEIEFPVLLRCETCSGAAPSRAPSRRPARSATAAARSARSARRCSARWSTSAPARAAGARAGSSRSPCETCHGDGRTERRRTLRVSIPPGIDEGHQIRLSNEGEVGPRGGAAGSLYVAVHVQPHPSLKRDGTELFYEAQVSIAQAALGTRITVPTVEGDEEVEIKAGHPAGHRDPAARQGRPAPPPGGSARRPARPGRRGGPDQALEEGPRAARRLCRGGRRIRRVRERRHSREARARLSATAPADAGSEVAVDGAWLELAVEADVEAVEAVSEILGRAAPGRNLGRARVRAGRRGARRQGRPDAPGDRPGLPAGPRPGRGGAGGRRRRRGPRPPPGLRPATDRRAAHAARPRGRLGRGLEGVLPGPARRPAAGHPANLAPPPPAPGRRRAGAGSGDGVRDRAAPDDPALPGGPRGAGRPRRSWPGAAFSTSAAARGSWRSPP